MKDLTDKEFITLRDYIKTNFGINLGSEKKSLVYSRLRTTLQELGMNDFTEYFKYLTNDKSGEAVVRFIDKITTNHTFFMREVDHFDFFRDNVLPALEAKHAGQKDLRVWCAGCSSGEEPYTLQMIIQDHFRNKPGWNTQLLATDISSKVLEKAVKGVYPGDSVNTLPAPWRKQYFKPSGADFAVSDQIKKEIVFRKFNLMEEKFPFRKPFQVIFCRNVMIYFDNETRDALVNRYCDVTEQGGFLFIGHSESLSHSTARYKYLMPAIYQKV